MLESNDCIPKSSTISAAVGRLVGSYLQHVRSRFSLKREEQNQDFNSIECLNFSSLMLHFFTLPNCNFYCLMLLHFMINVESIYIIVTR